ncbi:hypothetical protein B0O80DRAFT_447867 [Mortierella sp. GBAus27b]|nr:hypothetical protein BGX31_006519 [Mortierella sp. GBA43]KAI8355762.1 hypothetical protein B0O80DRAFT_447867 [Mortierella sp. GBAus27b]
MPSLKQRSGKRKDDTQSSHEKNGFHPDASETVDKRHHGPKKSPLGSWIFFLSFLSLLALIAYRCHYTLPTPVIEERHPVTGEIQFSEGNVRKLTEYLAEDIGLRLIGTESVDETEKYLLREIQAIKDKAKIEAARGAVGLPKFDVWIQTDDGSHRFDFMSKVVMKTYTNMTNIIVRLSCGPECDQSAILLNAHYDTTLGSPGAADDALGVGVQMELIRILSQQPALKKNSVVFLFNGGEESLQDASHSFITNHELKDTVKAVINLEGCGTTGPEILFQANSRAMIDAYKKVPYPHGTVIANDLFATGIILSDTDFRQFVDHGNLTGLDMAVYTNSYLYHTHLDLNQYMEQGLPQHMGENTLALVKHLGDEIDLTGGLEKTSEVVYFDVLGYHFIVYSLSTAVKLHLAIGVLALIAIQIASSQPRVRTILSVAASFAAAMLAPCLVAFSLKYFGKSMVWFTHEWWPIAIFGPSSAAAMLVVQYLFHDKKVSNSVNELTTFSGVQFFFAIIMGSATYAGLGSSYLLALYTFCYSAALLYNHYIIRVIASSTPGSRKAQQGLVSEVDFSTYLLASILPSTYFFYTMYSLLDIMIPLTGRLGTEVPVDTIVALVTGLGVFCSCPPILAYVHRFGQPLLKRVIVGLLVIQAFTLLYSTTFLQPFDRLHPKRIFAQHLRNTTSGETLVYVAHADNAPVYENYVHLLEDLFQTKAVFKSGKDDQGDWNAIYPFSQFLDSYILDTTPYIRSQTKNQTIATSSNPLTDLIHEAPKLVAENISYNPDTGLRRLTVLCIHPNYILTVVGFDAQLTSWSLSSDIPSHDHFHYVIRSAGGYRTDGWRLDLEYRAKGPDDKLRIEITSLETEGFDWRVERERELVGSGEIGVMRKVVKATPDFIALTYFSTVVSAFDL